LKGKSNFDRKLGVLLVGSWEGNTRVRRREHRPRAKERTSIFKNDFGVEKRTP